MGCFALKILLRLPVKFEARSKSLRIKKGRKKIKNMFEKSLSNQILKNKTHSEMLKQ